MDDLKKLGYVWAYDHFWKEVEQADLGAEIDAVKKMETDVWQDYEHPGMKLEFDIYAKGLPYHSH